MPGATAAEPVLSEVEGDAALRELEIFLQIHPDREMPTGHIVEHSTWAAWDSPNRVPWLAPGGCSTFGVHVGIKPVSLGAVPRFQV